jgi:hypothetical protein
MFKTLLKTLGVIALASVMAGTYENWSAIVALARRAISGTPAPVATTQTQSPVARLKPPSLQFAPAMILDLPAAIDQELVTADFRSNGREKIHFSIMNKCEQRVRLHIPAGLIFQNSTSSVILLRARNLNLKAGELREEDFVTAATSSSNQIVDNPYSITMLSEPRLMKLLDYLKDHPEVSRGTVQTVILALKENLPVSAFAKFAQAGGDLPSKYDTSAFKVDTSEILSALILLRNLGVPDDQLALTIDPQLKIEAMIDPLAHAFAMRYYGINAQNEWDYWKHHLLEGEISTRHYALYGIARFYPDVALKMLPMWVRDLHISSVYRLSAVQAMAETQKPEAVSMLRQLEHEFGLLTEIGQAAHNAANVLDTRLSKAASATAAAIAFRTTREVPQL